MVFAINNEGAEHVHTRTTWGKKKHISCHCAVTQIQLGSDISHLHTSHTVCDNFNCDSCVVKSTEKKGHACCGFRYMIDKLHFSTSLCCFHLHFTS